MATYTPNSVIPFKAKATFSLPEYDGPYTYAWIFADNATATGQYATHAYATTGSKTSSVSATNQTTSEVVTATITDTIVDPGWVQATHVPPRNFMGAIFAELNDGKILIFGGYTDQVAGVTYYQTCYEFNGFTFTQVGNLNIGRAGGYRGILFDPSFRDSNYFLRGITLNNGKVFFIGSTSDNADVLKGEIYDPVAKTWSLVPAITVGYVYADTISFCKTDNGDVLVFMYSDGAGKVYKYNVNSNSWTLYAQQTAPSYLAKSVINIGNNKYFIASTGGYGASQFTLLDANNNWSFIAGTYGFSTYYQKMNMVKAGDYVYFDSGGSTPRCGKYRISTGIVSSVIALESLEGGSIYTLLDGRYISAGGTKVFDTSTDTMAVATWNHITTPTQGRTPCITSTYGNGIISLCQGADGLSLPEIFYV